MGDQIWGIRGIHEDLVTPPPSLAGVACGFPGIAHLAFSTPPVTPHCPPNFVIFFFFDNP